MSITQEERNQLLEFIKSHYVDFHDVRLLIARDKEEKIISLMEDDETLTFDEALQEAFKDYGVIGFSDVSEEYMKAINLYFYKKVFLTILKDELSTLKFWGLVSAFFLIVFTIITLLNTKPFILGGGFLLLIIAGFVFYFRKFYKQIKELRKSEKHYYLDDLLVSNNSAIFPFSYLPIIIAPNIGKLTENEVWSMSILSFSMTISFIVFYLIFFRLYKDRSEILEKYKKNYLSEKLNSKLKFA